jgi:heme-degrading monooxygenase HmoA
MHQAELRRGRVWRSEVQRAMWPMAVVVVDEDSEHAVEVALIDDQQPVEALGADGPDEALCDRISLRRPHGRLDDLDAFAGEHGVKVARELAVAVADQEPKRPQTYVWITTRRLRPGTRDEFSRAWRPSEFPEGMLRAYECYSPDGNEVVGISIWDSLESRERFRLSEVESKRRQAMAPFLIDERSGFYLGRELKIPER